MHRIVRDRRLTPEEAAKYRNIRKEIAEELPELTVRHHDRLAAFDQLAELLKQLRAAREERGNLILDGLPGVSAALTERVAPWLQARSAEFRGWLPDGSMLVTTRFAETDQLHRVAAPLGAREQLTYGAEVLAANASPAPGATGVPFATTVAGAPPQLWVWRFADHSTARVTGSVVRTDALVWSPDGKIVAVQGVAADGMHRDIVAFEPGGRSTKRRAISAAGRRWRSRCAASSDPAVSSVR